MGKALQILTIIMLVLVVAVSSIELYNYVKKGGCKCKDKLDDPNYTEKMRPPVQGAQEHDETEFEEGEQPSELPTN